MAGENYINHVVLVLDASSSMYRHQKELIQVADSQVQYLAQRSQDLDQETRVSIYAFNENVKCLIYDKDVLRLPSIKTLYQSSGMTALIDATMKSLDDLEKTATLYGDHAFLTFVLTDGLENASHVYKRATLAPRLRDLEENWTVACLVPDQRAVFEAKGHGFPKDNVAVWDPQSAEGIQEVGKTIRTATDNFMEARTKGVRGTRSLFSTGLDTVNKSTVRSTLTALANNKYDIIPVHKDSPIKEFVYSRTGQFTLGKGYYQLTKTETIQANKKIAIREKSTGKVFSGEAARDVLGLPHNTEVRVQPNFNPEYDVFVQSTAVNRKLLKNTDVLVLT